MLQRRVFVDVSSCRIRTRANQHLHQLLVTPLSSQHKGRVLIHEVLGFLQACTIH